MVRRFHRLYGVDAPEHHSSLRLVWVTFKVIQLLQIFFNSNIAENIALC